MKIHQLVIENYKTISAICLDVNGKNLSVAGSTGQGKTTTISALWDIVKSAGKPIKEGEAKGKIRIVLGHDRPELVVERRFTAKSKSLSINQLNENDNRPKPTAGEFKDWFCNLAINPHKIMDMGPTERVKHLLEVVEFPEGFNLEGVEDSIEQFSDTIKMLKDSIKRVDHSLGEEPPKGEKVSLVDLLAEKEAMEAHNKSIKDVEENVIVAHTSIKSLFSEIEELKKQIKEKEEKIKTYQHWLSDTEKWLDTNTTKDTTAIDEKIRKSELLNQQFNDYGHWVAKKKQRDGMQEDLDKSSDVLSNLKSQKKSALENASWPVSGVSIEDGEICYQGIPLTQCGTSQQMLVCGALAASKIAESELKVVRMDGIESMSKEDFQVLEKIFNDNEIQVFSSRVTRGDIEEGEILIKDGGVQNV